MLSSCRFIEVNGQSVCNLSEGEFNQLLTKTQPPVKVILLREVGNEPISSGDTSELEALKEDLSLVMMDLDAVQQDNKDLVMDIER